MLLSNKKFSSFLDTHSTRRFKKGSIIIYQGEVPRDVFFVKSGVVKVYTINSQGDERIVVFRMQGDIFPSLPTVRDKPVSASYYYEALSDVELYVTPYEELKNLIFQDPALLALFTEYYVNGYTNSLMRISALEQAKASDKIVHTIYYLLQGYGKEIHEDLYKIDVNLTQQTMASLIGLTRETTANELLKLKKRKVLSYKSQRYMVYRQKLLQLIGEDNFMNV